MTDAVICKVISPIKFRITSLVMIPRTGRFHFLAALLITSLEILPCMIYILSEISAVGTSWIPNRFAIFLFQLICCSSSKLLRKRYKKCMTNEIRLCQTLKAALKMRGVKYSLSAASFSCLVVHHPRDADIFLDLSRSYRFADKQHKHRFGLTAPRLPFARFGNSPAKLCIREKSSAIDERNSVALQHRKDGGGDGDVM